MSGKEKLLHAASAGNVIVEEVGRRWGYVHDEKGDLLMALLIIEVVYYSIKLAQIVWKWWQGRKVAVREEKTVWRSYQRERVIETRRMNRRAA